MIQRTYCCPAVFSNIKRAKKREQSQAQQVVRFLSIWLPFRACVHPWAMKTKGEEGEVVMSLENVVQCLWHGGLSFGCLGSSG